jgi:hypothetical protein|tara:strand:+ start:252 stop:485 length:234 start_codon:yes stop_codon:yes gene_type:complete
MSLVETKSGLPWQNAGKTVDYFVEVGTTPYGKYGLYKEMVNVGTDVRGKHLEMAESIRMSNPEIFENLHLRQIVSRG